MKGKALVWGISPVGGVTISCFATFIPQSAKIRHEFNLVDEQDANGFDTSAIATNGRLMGTVNLKPSGATRAAAALVCVSLTPLLTVTLSGFTVTAFNGGWQYIGNEEIDLANNAAATISLPVRKYDDDTQNTLMLTTVSG